MTIKLALNMGLGLMLALGSGCALIRRGAESMMTPMAAGMANSLQKQSDIQLVRDGAPAYLLLLDGLVESSPDNPTLLLTAANAQTAYAMAFLEKNENARAQAMYAKARDYGLQALKRNKKFKKVCDQPVDIFSSSLSSFRKKDVPALYTTATAWAAWIISTSGAMDAMAQFPKVLALMNRAYELDPGYQYGGADTFFGIYYAVQPHGAGRNLPKSKEHFEQAFQYAGPDYLLPRVAFAEFYARYAFDRDLFEKTLRAVIRQTQDKPEFRLMNEVARKRARLLLDQADEFF